jgi:hypothetical protein
MKLYRYAQGSEWTVYLYCQSETTCQILETLLGCGELGTRMLADLHKVATRSRASLERDREFSKVIVGTRLLEFRLPTSRGATPRVSYFFDRNQIIVCALALLKKRDTLPPLFIKESEAIRKAYFDSGGLKTATIEIYRDAEEGEP